MWLDRWSSDAGRDAGATCKVVVAARWMLRRRARQAAPLRPQRRDEGRLESAAAKEPGSTDVGDNEIAQVDLEKCRLAAGATGRSDYEAGIRN